MRGHGERQGQQVCLGCENVVLHVKRYVVRFSKQQEQVLKHLSEEERVHSEKNDHINSLISGNCKEVSLLRSDMDPHV